MSLEFTRRQFLKITGAGSILFLAGCLEPISIEIEIPKIVQEKKRRDQTVLRTEIFWQDDPKDSRISFIIADNALQPSVHDQIKVSSIKMSAFFQQFPERVSCSVRYGLSKEPKYMLNWHDQLKLDLSRTSKLSLTLANWQVVQVKI